MYYVFIAGCESSGDFLNEISLEITRRLQSRWALKSTRRAEQLHTTRKKTLFAENQQILDISNVPRVTERFGPSFVSSLKGWRRISQASGWRLCTFTATRLAGRQHQRAEPTESSLLRYESKCEVALQRVV